MDKVTKDKGMEQLCDAIQVAADGRYYFPGGSGDRIFSHMQTDRMRQKEKRLTPKEEEFLGWCLRPGMGYKQIADTMHITERTVNGYRESIFSKL